MPTQTKARPKKKKAAKPPTPPVEPPRYWEAVGRRKTAVARVRLFTEGKERMVVNERAPEAYFPTLEMRSALNDSLRVLNLKPEQFSVSVKVRGGGVHAQAEAVRHGLARALLLFNPEFRSPLKHAGFLRRDPRMVERKKYGLKKARRAPQWAKR